MHNIPQSVKKVSLLAAPDPPVITDCYLNVDGFTVVTWLPSDKPEEHQVPGSEFFVDYNEVGQCNMFSACMHSL